MGRKTTRAKQILGDAKQRLDAAFSVARQADAAVEQATTFAGEKWSIAGALETEYKALEKVLAPKPRQQPAATKGAATRRRGGGGKRKQQSESPQCAQKLTNNGTCAFPEDHLIHGPDGGYSGYHPFVPPARPARNQSPPNGAGGSSTANIEDETASALTAAETGV
jgi:hypothetical protein